MQFFFSSFKKYCVVKKYEVFFFILKMLLFFVIPRIFHIRKGIKVIFLLFMVRED